MQAGALVGGKAFDMRIARALSALAVAAVIASPCPLRAEIADLVADAVFGQSGFTDPVALPIGPAAFAVPKGVAIDRSVTPNRVYVSDSVYHRVLGWADADALANGAPADLVIGQPDAWSWGCNGDVAFDVLPPAPTASSLCAPAGLAVDATGTLYVADARNCRVLVFRDPFGTDGVADAVLGQSAPGYQGCGIGPDHLDQPTGVAVDAAGNVFVADTLNCRVLEFDSPLTTDTIADRVYGQSAFDAPTCGAQSLYFPADVAVDASERLWVSSPGNVLFEFDDALHDTVVDRQLGTRQCNFGGEAASTTCGVLSAAIDADGRLFLADSGNDRVLEFDDPFAVSQASRVFGQPGFTGSSTLAHDECNAGGPSATSLCFRQVAPLLLGGTYNEAGALRLDGAGRLWVADGLNHRVLRYDTPLATRAADLVLGQAKMTDVRKPVFPLDAPQAAIAGPYVLALEPAESRVLVYYDYDYTRATPFAVIGQPDFESTTCNTGGASAASLCHPRGLAVSEHGALWIADSGNNRVLEYAAPWITYDAASRHWVPKTVADAVFGQPDFTSTACGAGASGLCGPRGVAFDPTRGILYVADTANNRIVRHENPLADAIADGAFGQPDLAGTACDAGGIGASSLCGPESVALDADGSIWAADTGNHRVLLYTTPAATSATLVVGQASMDTAAPGAGPGGLASPTGVAVDRKGNLYVADRDNDRVLEYDAPRATDTLADRVFGQPDFATVACGVSDHALCRPIGVAIGEGYLDTVLVADAGNDRVLRFDAPFCLDDYQLTAANRRSRAKRSKPTATSLKLLPGPAAADDMLAFKGQMIVLDPDTGILAGDSPLMTLSTATGVVYEERVPDLSSLSLGRNSEVWGTRDLKGERDRGIDDFQIKEKSVFSSASNDYEKYAWKGRSVGQDLTRFPTGPATWRVRYGGVCFTTELACANGRCKPAR